MFIRYPAILSLVLPPPPPSPLTVAVIGEESGYTNTI